MEPGPGLPELRRLIDEGNETAELLRTADHEFGQGLDEPRAFYALERRRCNFGYALAALWRGFLRTILGRPIGPPAPLVRKN